MKLKFLHLTLLILAVVLAACGSPDTPVPADPVPVDEPAAQAETEAPNEDNEDNVDHDSGDQDDADDSHNDEVVPISTENTEESKEADSVGYTGEVNLDYFFDGALAREVVTVDCTLSDGTQTQCYEITIAGEPANHDIGPFCPETTETAAEDAGIWFDGNAVYDVDGEFILGLADLYNDNNWKLYNDDGTVKITDTEEAFDAAARPNVDPEYQNHCVAGEMAWLDNGEPVQTTVTIPIQPVPAENTTTGGNWGITLNGVIIAEAAPVNAILSAYTIAVFDDCGGHINPFDGYHLHGDRGCSEVGEATADETPIFAYAMDGYPIHSALSDEQLARVELDECNGHETEEHGYHYHANPAEENSVLTCFKGLTVASGDAAGPPDGGRGDGGPPAGGEGQGQGRRQGGAPDFAAAAEQLGVTEQELVDAIGGPPPDFAAAAEILGVTEEALEGALGGPPGGRGGRGNGGG